MSANFDDGETARRATLRDRIRMAWGNRWPQVQMRTEDLHASMDGREPSAIRPYQLHAEEVLAAIVSDDALWDVAANLRSELVMDRAARRSPE